MSMPSDSTAPNGPAPVTVASATVQCDGGGPLGHPAVYLKIGPSGEIVCPYCSRRFVFDKPAAAH